MAELKATVCLQGKDIEVISSHIEFNRKTDNKGRPVTNVIIFAEYNFITLFRI